MELIIWENIAYLANDERRAAAFDTLKQIIGTRPEQILAAKHSALAAIGKSGILPDISAEKRLAMAKLRPQLRCVAGRKSVRCARRISWVAFY
jgi:hypothetical protein